MKGKVKVRKYQGLGSGKTKNIGNTGVISRHTYENGTYW